MLSSIYVLPAGVFVEVTQVQFESSLLLQKQQQADGGQLRVVADLQLFQTWATNSPQPGQLTWQQLAALVEVRACIVICCCQLDKAAVSASWRLPALHGALEHMRLLQLWLQEQAYVRTFVRCASSCPQHHSRNAQPEYTWTSPKLHNESQSSCSS